MAERHNLVDFAWIVFPLGPGPRHRYGIYSHCHTAISASKHRLLHVLYLRSILLSFHSYPYLQYSNKHCAEPRPEYQDLPDEIAVTKSRPFKTLVTLQVASRVIQAWTLVYTFRRSRRTYYRRISTALIDIPSLDSTASGSTSYLN